MNDTTLSSDNTVRFKKKPITYYLLTVSKKIKTADSKVEKSKAQNNFNRQAAKISALLSWNIGKYEFLTDK